MIGALQLKQSLLIVMATIGIVGSTLVVGPAAAMANDTSQTAQEKRVTAKLAATEKREAAQARLADKKLAACQKREAKINNIMAHIASRGEKQLAVFTKIADRTKTFYTNKGKTLSNYDALVAEVDAKKAAAETAIEQIKTTSATFKCDGTDPKGAAASFKESLKTEIAALKAYKTAVKNLIVGVKSVQGTTTSGDKPAGDTTTGGEQE